MIKEKRGLSEVVSVILIILIALVAVAILSAVIISFFGGVSENVGIEGLAINLKIVEKRVEINNTAKNVSFDVKRNVGEGNVTGLKIILEDTVGNEKLFDFSLIINEFDTKRVFVDFFDLGLGNLSKISIAPVFRRGDKDVVGNIVDVYIVAGAENAVQGDLDLSWPPVEYIGLEDMTVAYEWNGYNVGTGGHSGIEQYPNGSINNLVSMFWLDHRNGNNWIARADVIADTVNAMPVGHRALFTWRPHLFQHQNESDFCEARNPENGNQLEKFSCIWWENGTEQIYGLFDDFFTAYVAEGGELDVFVMDTEIGMHMWSCGGQGALDWCNRSSEWANVKAQAIEEDVRFAGNVDDNVSQQLIDLGFPPGDRINDTVWRWWEGGDNYLIWNEVMLNRTAGYKNRGIYEPVAKYYPNVKASDWQFKYNNVNLAFPLLGHDNYKYGNGSIVGTHQSWNFYGNHHRTERNESLMIPFEAFQYNVNTMRGMYLARPDVPIHPWVSNRGISTRAFYDSEYYQEMVFHTGLAGADDFIYWQSWLEHEWADDFLLSDTLHELDELIGYGVNKQTLITSLADWDEDYLLTGMEVGNYKVWRITPDEAVSFSVSGFGDRVEVTVGARLVIFPEAIVYTSPNETSGLGRWIVSYANAQEPFVQ